MPTNAVHTSVPPLIDDTGHADACRAPSGTRRPAAARRSSRPSAARPGAGATPALRHAIRNGADTPKTVTPVSAARSHSVVERRAPPGSPSNSTIVAPDEQPRHEVVPHHPAGGGEPAEAVAGAEVLVQGEHLEVLDGDAAVAVHDRLRQPGGARAEQHVQRVVERAPARTSSGASPVGEQRRGQVGAAVGPVAPSRYGTCDDVAQRRQRGDDRVDLGRAVDRPCRRSGSRRRRAARSARSGRTGRSPSARRTRARSSTRPRRATRWRGRRRASRGCSGRSADDPVAGADAEPAQAGRRAAATCSASSAHVSSIAAPRSGCGRSTATSPGRVGCRGQRLLGVVQRAAGEPAHAGHRRRRRACAGGRCRQRTPVSSVHARQKPPGRRPTRRAARRSRRSRGRAKRPASVVVHTSAGGVQSTSPRAVMPPILASPSRTW